MIFLSVLVALYVYMNTNIYFLLFKKKIKTKRTRLIKDLKQLYINKKENNFLIRNNLSVKYKTETTGAFIIRNKNDYQTIIWNVEIRML